MADEIETTDTTDNLVPEQMDEDPKDEAEAAEAADDGDGEGEEPGGKPAPKAKPAAKPAPKTYRTKANGKEIEVPAEHVDALSKLIGVEPDMLLRGGGMLRAGQEKLRAAAEEAKKAEALRAKLKADPRAALREALGDEEAFLKVAIEAVAELAEQEELAKKDPAELTRRKREAELRAREEALAQKEKEREEAEAAEFQTAVARRVDNEIRSALEAGKLPPVTYSVKRLAAIMMDHLDKGGDADDLVVDDFLPQVLEESDAEIAEFFKKIGGARFIERFPDFAEEVRKGFAERVPGSKLRVAPKEQPEPRPKDEKPKERKFRSTNDVLAAFKAGRI